MTPSSGGQQKRGREAKLETGGGGRSGFNLVRVLEVAGILGGIVVAGFVLGSKIEGAIDGGDDVRLEIAEPTVVNPPAQFNAGGVTAATQPRVTATVRNRGADTAWIDEARITVLSSAHLEVCYSQGGSGDVPASQRYAVTLPEFPPTSPRLLRRPLHVEVQPGQGVRPVVNFQKPDLGVDGLYALKVEFVADPGGHVLDAGRFVIGVPGPVSRGGAVVPESERLLGYIHFTHDVREIAWCFHNNLAKVRRLIAEPGLRSVDVAALGHLQLAPSWPQIDRRWGHESVSGLLDSESSEAAMYAVELAELSGGEVRAAKVRKRAVNILVERSRAELDDEVLLASLRDAERARSLQPSAATRRLVWRVTSARDAEERRLKREVAEFDTG